MERATCWYPSGSDKATCVFYNIRIAVDLRRTMIWGLTSTEVSQHCVNTQRTLTLRSLHTKQPALDFLCGLFEMYLPGAPLEARRSRSWSEVSLGDEKDTVIFYTVAYYALNVVER